MYRIKPHQVWWTNIPYDCGKCNQTMDEIEQLISANDPTMKIIKKEKNSLNSIGSMTFKCGVKNDKNRIVPVAQSQIKKVECRCDAQTPKKYRTGEKIRKLEQISCLSRNM